MRSLDWAIVLGYIVWVVVDGLRRAKGTDKIDGYFVANRSLPWWVVGLSVMATQMSAVTLVGTTGQAYLTGLRFIQFYFGLPLAMIILSVTVVPFFHRAKVFTAYEYLEQRFDVVKQMVIIVSGMAAAVVILILGIPRDVGLGPALHMAGATGRLRALDFRFDLRETYTVWSGLIGGLFLMLAYFGCDQSQVQRYLTAKSIDEARSSLMMSAYVKIPLQLLVLSTGVLVFVFYVFQTPPMLFNRAYDARVAAGPRAADYAALEQQFTAAFDERRRAAEQADRAAFLAADERVSDIRARAVAIVKDTTGDEGYNDVNYVFPTFITTRMPIGLVGLMIAAIFAAAMSASAGELNSLATATIIDFYRRHFVTAATDAHYLSVSKLATIGWGLFACVVAMYAANQGSLIEVVNRYGSFFYGSLLGVFILAILTRRATAAGAFWGLIAGMAVVLTVAFTLPIAFLWHNLIGAMVVVAVGLAISATTPGCTDIHTI